jgi:hypothetical protein
MQIPLLDGLRWLTDGCFYIYPIAGALTYNLFLLPIVMLYLPAKKEQIINIELKFIDGSFSFY